MSDLPPLETLVGVFDDRAQAENAVRGLEEAGYTHDELGFLTPGGGTDPRDDYGKKVVGTTVGATVAGGLTGGVLAALATGLIPGIGPVIGGGMLAVLVASQTAGAGSGIAGMLFTSAGAEDPRTNYSEYLKAGKTLVTVTGTRAEKARQVIAQAGGRFPVDASAVNRPQPAEDPVAVKNPEEG